MVQVEVISMLNLLACVVCRSGKWIISKKWRPSSSLQRNGPHQIHEHPKMSQVHNTYAIHSQDNFARINIETTSNKFIYCSVGQIQCWGVLYQSSHSRWTLPRWVPVCVVFWQWLFWCVNEIGRTLFSTLWRSCPVRDKEHPSYFLLLERRYHTFSLLRISNKTSSPS